MLYTAVFVHIISSVLSLCRRTLNAPKNFSDFLKWKLEWNLTQFLPKISRRKYRNKNFENLTLKCWENESKMSSSLIIFDIMQFMENYFNENRAVIHLQHKNSTHAIIFDLLNIQRSCSVTSKFRKVASSIVKPSNLILPSFWRCRGLWRFIQLNSMQLDSLCMD